MASTPQLRFGIDSAVEMALPPERLLATCGDPRRAALADPGAAIAAALAEPLDFPPLAQAVIPGDRVALAIEHGLPQAPVLVARLIRTLLATEPGPAEICVLQARADRDCLPDDVLALLAANQRERVEFAVHDPHHRDSLCYLAADESGSPIYVNRRLFDADVVLPLGCLRLDAVLGYYGANATLYPAFSDQPTLDRFETSGIGATADEIARRRHEADEVAWLIGAQMTIQVVPAAGGGVLDVLAGTSETVGRRGKELCQATWSYEIPRRAELVVAGIEGASGQQTWENVGRALAAAARAVTDQGAIALCTELADEPSATLRSISRAKDLPAALRRLRKHHSADAAAAYELAQALDHVQVYLLSRLDEEVVEELGVGHVASATEIARLASRRGSCILLANAQYAVPTAVEEVAVM